MATGVPHPIYHWRHNGAIVPNETKPTLTFSNTQPENAGLYSVAACNFLGLRSGLGEPFSAEVVVEKDYGKVRACG